MSFLTYTAPDGTKWRIERSAELLREFDLAPATLPEWHRIMAAIGPAWEAVCRSYAVFDILATGDHALMVPMTDEDLAKKLGLKPAHVTDLLTQARDYWMKVARATGAGQVVPIAPLTPPMEEPERDAICARYGFITSDPVERAIIAARCRELGTFLEQDLLRSTAISLIQQERHLAAVDDQLTTEKNKKEKADSKEMRALLVTRGDVQSKIEATMERLGVWDTPDAMKRKAAFSDCIGTVVQAMQDYYARGDRDLIDGVFTEGEVQVLLRDFDVRRPQYRLDLSLITAPAAIAGLWDPEFTPPKLPRYAARRIAACARASLASARQEDGIDVEDLDRDPEGTDDD